MSVPTASHNGQRNYPMVKGITEWPKASQNDQRNYPTATRTSEYSTKPGWNIFPAPGGANNILRENMCVDVYCNTLVYLPIVGGVPVPMANVIMCANVHTYVSNKNNIFTCIRIYQCICLHAYVYITVYVYMHTYISIYMFA